MIVLDEVIEAIVNNPICEGWIVGGVVERGWSNRDACGDNPWQDYCRFGDSRKPATLGVPHAIGTNHLMTEEQKPGQAFCPDNSAAG